MSKIRLNDFTKGFIDTLPIGISVSIYGVVYGVLGGNAGLSVWMIAAMSFIVFAGASQIAMVQMFMTGSDPVSVILTVFIINLRHFLMAASMGPLIKNASTKMKMISSYIMTDESYAVSYTHFQKNKPNVFYFFGSGMNIYVFWGSSSLIGFFFGSVIPPELNYVLGFAFVAAFMSMLVPLVKDLPVVTTVIVSAIISVLGSMFLPGKWYIIIAGLIGSLAGYLASIVKEGDLKNE